MKMFFKEFVERLSAKMACPLPVSGWLEITQRCNLNCKFCFMGKYKNKKPDIPKDKIFKIVKELKECGCIEITLSGGEPLVRKDFLEIYQYVKKEGFLITIYTNGTLLTEKVVNIFYRYPPRILYISLHAGSSEGYKKITGRASAFKDVKRGIELLKKKNIQFRIKTLITRINFDEIDKIIQFCKSIKVKPEIYTYVISPFQKGDYNPEKLVLTSREKEILFKKIPSEYYANIEKTIEEGKLFNPCYHAIITNEGRLLSPFWKYRFWYSKDALKGNMLEMWRQFVSRREVKR